MGFVMVDTSQGTVAVNPDEISTVEESAPGSGRTEIALTLGEVRVPRAYGGVGVAAESKVLYWRGVTLQEALAAIEAAAQDGA